MSIHLEMMTNGGKISKFNFTFSGESQKVGSWVSSSDCWELAWVYLARIISLISPCLQVYYAGVSETCSLWSSCGLKHGISHLFSQTHRRPHPWLLPWFPECYVEPCISVWMWPGHPSPHCSNANSLLCPVTKSTLFQKSMYWLVTSPGMDFLELHSHCLLLPTRHPSCPVNSTGSRTLPLQAYSPVSRAATLIPDLTVFQLGVYKTCPK